MTAGNSRLQYDPTLFEGTAWYYARYRPLYPPQLFEHLARCYRLDGTGRALDLGCGTGQLALALASYFEQVVGMDPDEEMLKTARQLTSEAKISNLHFTLESSWDLSPTMGEFNGTITNDKFCMSRTGRLQLSWWRLPLRARAVVSNEVESSCEGNNRQCCPQEETNEETTMDGSASDGGVS